jgi:cytochrome c oxidase subunit 2
MVNTMANSLMSLLWSVFVQCDAAEPWQIGFQDGASPTFEGITELHDAIFFYLVLIFVGVMWVMGSTVINYSSTANPISHKYSNHGTLIELVWTITPAFILIAIAFPSFKLLYLMDDVISPAMTIKAVGHQWYWSYEYSDFVNEDGESIEFDSYMIPDSDLEDGQLRLLDVDNRVVLPVDTHVRFVVTGADVIHDFAVPSLGLKIDCTPGRTMYFAPHNTLNQATITECVSIYYGLNSVILITEATNVNSGQTTEGSNNTNILWVETPNIAAGRSVLITMIESLPQDSPLVKFLTERGGWLLAPLAGDTGIPAKGKNDPHVLGPTTTVTQEGIKNIRGDINNKSGCYMFMNTATGLFYIGSATNLLTRLKYHYHVPTKRATTTLYSAAVPLGWFNFTWSQLVSTTNYMFEYTKSVSISLTDEQAYILRSFTQFEARIFEQALLSYHFPLQGHTIVFPFMAWHPGYTDGNTDGVAITATSVNTGEVYQFSSINQAAVMLGLSRASVMRYLNLIGRYVHSPVIGDVYLVDPNRSMEDRVPSQRWLNSSDPISGINIDNLEPGKLYAFHTDKVTLFGTYTSPGEAAMVLDGKIDNKYIRRYINLERIVLVGADNTPIYFVMNPAYKDDMACRAGNRSVIVQSPKYLLEDTILGITTQHRTYKDILSHIGSTATPESIKRYVNSGKKLHKQYLITTIDR